MSPEPCTRRALLLAGGTLLALASGCGTSPTVRLHRLPLEAPQTPAPPADAGAVWEVVMRPELPAYLDRDEMLIDQGPAGIAPLPGQRWAEPLAEAVPRLMLHDLALLRGARRVWPAPAPAGAAASHRLRWQVLDLQAAATPGRLRLQARWTLETRTGAGSAPQVGLVDLEVPLPQADAAGLVQAHRLALWRLAQRIVADAGG
jgi:uncharacterized protein